MDTCEECGNDTPLAGYAHCPECIPAATVANLGRVYAERQTEAQLAKQALRVAIVDAVRHHNMTESEAARQAGVTRMTVRAWLGKGSK